MSETAQVWSDVFEPRPRFKGCPPICLKTNLPSFQTEAAARKWVGEGYEIVKIGGCGFCKHFHVISRPADLSQLPANFCPFRRSSPFYGTPDKPLTINWSVIARKLAEREVEYVSPLHWSHHV
ncbi:MAG TPA: hypothetical protein VN281_05170 [Verrucomicrobiae bacterium]|nr:hypothetical protein [Verrucomicrobiae bacterium]